ncbi:TM2 domain-containing protein [Mucilaginibacter myungsuensis]|uniref:TM2 domain-containing protein n=1 Tax=Mucilaginibacter myungsuensis TaxID=649104 RepID=A0A929KYK9_9SPHI|nr:TM2 domain-containing protein [Mucilaginibacter myungsuensis]MBE9662920.1 TM2 domain-containing protein [Mucilaginibacter myungsuensis]MDN3598542.1 TM2 domain-containing protein [Mucilaginibacter myungsuensis]
MDAKDAYMNFPGMTSQELTMLQRATAGLTAEQEAYFLNIYATKRKNPEDIKMYCIASILVPGLHRLMLGQTTWAIMYFFTGGFFFVMTVMDLINYEQLTIDHNEDVAYEAFAITQNSFSAAV